MKELLEEMQKNSQYIRKQGFNLVECWECEWRAMIQLREKFSEMCPIFKNTEISRDDIGEFIKTYAEENDIMRQPRHSLIGSMMGEKILLATPLLKWCLEHGLQVRFKYRFFFFVMKSTYCIKIIFR